MDEIREDNAQEEKEAEKSEVEKPSPDEVPQTTDQEMVKMQQELEQAEDMMLRLAAELDNYKKRVAKERESLIKYANQEIIQGLLPTLDNFERAIESVEKSKDLNSFIEGIRMIAKQMFDALERNGVKKIDALGKPFDPNIHEAVMQVASDQYPENTVAQEFQKGYMLHERVIRPSMVAVSRGAEEK